MGICSPRYANTSGKIRISSFTDLYLKLLLEVLVFAITYYKCDKNRGCFKLFLS